MTRHPPPARYQAGRRAVQGVIRPITSGMSENAALVLVQLRGDSRPLLDEQVVDPMGRVELILRGLVERVEIAPGWPANRLTPAGREVAMRVIEPSMWVQ